MVLSRGKLNQESIVLVFHWWAGGRSYGDILRALSDDIQEVEIVCDARRNRVWNGQQNMEINL